MAIGYFTDVNEANIHFAANRLNISAWSALTPAQRSAVLMQAFQRLYYSKEFVLPTLAEATIAELPTLQLAQAEFAYYLALDNGDEDRRKGLQAQSTIEAGIIKEKYSEAQLKDTPVPQFVRDILGAYSSDIPSTAFGAIDLNRDENESVDTPVDGYYDT
jgi:hypothetical protein